MENFENSQQASKEKVRRDLSEVDTTIILESVEFFSDNYGGTPTFLKHISDPKSSLKKNFENDQYEKNSLEATLVSDINETLNATGLEIEMEKGYSSDITGENKLEHDELVINLKDGKQFVRYLKSLDPHSATVTQLESVRDIISGLAESVTYRYNLEGSGDDRLLELISNGNEILIESERLGIKSNFLEEVLLCSKEKCLKELVLAQNLLSYSFELGAHEMFPPSMFKKNWDKILDILVKVHDNPNARRLYEKALFNAKKYIDEAIDYFTNDFSRDNKSGIKEEYKISPEMRVKLIDIANSIKMRLEDF